MAYISPSQIERQRALSMQLRNTPYDNRSNPLSGLAHVLRQYGAGVGERRASESETANNEAQTQDLQKLAEILRTGGMSERQVSGMDGESLGTIPRKNFTAQTPEVGNMYAQALMNQEMSKTDKLMSPEEMAQQMTLKQAGSNSTEYGLSPNLYQTPDGKWVERIYNKSGQFTDREMPGEPVRGMTFNPALQGEIAGTKQQGVKDVDLTMNPQIEAATSEAGVVGKEMGMSKAKLADIEAFMPGMEQVTKKLMTLGEAATYTQAGKARDYVKRQLDMDVGDAANAREAYMSTVDNEVLPLLRQTFGAAFTVQEGQSLRDTFGDPDKSPSEKAAALEAVIDAKRREVENLKRRTMTPLLTEPAGVPDEGDSLIQKYLQGN